MSFRRPTKVILICSAALFVAFTVWLIHEANIGRDNILFKTVRSTPYGDKIGHFLLAGLLTLVANFLLRFREFQIKGLPIPYGTAIVLVLVVLEESSQHFMPTRSLDLKDAIANALGILTFTVLPRPLVNRFNRPEQE